MVNERWPSIPLRLHFDLPENALSLRPGQGDVRNFKGYNSVH